MPASTATAPEAGMHREWQQGSRPQAEQEAWASSVPWTSSCTCVAAVSSWLSERPDVKFLVRGWRLGAGERAVRAPVQAGRPAVRVPEAGAGGADGGAFHPGRLCGGQLEPWQRVSLYL